MIYLGQIPQTIIDKHWDYFYDSEGFKKINTHKNNASTSKVEKDIFEYIIGKEGLLRKILLGKPNDLKVLIRAYNKFIINKGLLFSKESFTFYKDFIVTGGWDTIWNTINTNEKRKVGIGKILERFESLDSRFLIIEQHLGITNNKLKNINGFKKRYTEIFNKLNVTIDRWNKLLASIFNYSQFSSKSKKWNAYNYTNELGVNVCPYCNRNYIHTVQSNDGSTRPELDHFYPKSIYPFLSISIYNLIPSCHICNSNLKRDNNFFEQEHIHPFEDLNSRKFKFMIKYKADNLNNLVVKLEDFEVTYDFVENISESQKKIVENSIQTFKTTELYNFHKDIAQEILFNAVYYNQSKREELESILGEDSGIDDNFIDRVIYGNYISENDFGKRPLAKFTSDIKSALK